MLLVITSLATLTTPQVLKAVFTQANVPPHETTPLCRESRIIITILKKSINVTVPEIPYLFSKTTKYFSLCYGAL